MFINVARKYTFSSKRCHCLVKPTNPTKQIDKLEFTLNYWITDPENGQLNIRSDVNTAILTALRSHNIDIPFPQQVVHDAKPRV